jgi:hypothetical protein
MGKVENRFGHEGTRDARPIMGRPAPPMPDGNEPVQLQQYQHTNELLVTLTH